MGAHHHALKLWGDGWDLFGFRTFWDFGGLGLKLINRLDKRIPNLSLPMMCNVMDEDSRY